MLRNLMCSMLVVGAVACQKSEEQKPVSVAPTTPPAEKSAQDKQNETINAAKEMDVPAFNFTAVQFGYDSSDLDDTARAQLDQAAKYLAANKQMHVTIAGHCDDRGTAEYNLALGEKRAAAVRKYLSTLGVAPDRLGTISFGELQPVDQAQTEEAFQKNRRADFKVQNNGGR